MRCSPVKKGWQFEHTSVWMAFFVEPVVQVFPQAQIT
jgi:hypothetical protein